MKNMDEISYWVYTKRAPCLLKYDSLKRQSNQAHCSKTNTDISPVENVPSPKKKKKRKLSILDGENSQKKQTIFYNNTKNEVKKNILLSECSDSVISDFKKSVNEKKKTPHNKKQSFKKIQVISSTPKSGGIKKCIIDKSNDKKNLDSSLESGLFSGETKNKQSSQSKTVSKRSDNLVVKQTNDKEVNNSSRNNINGVFDDISDVSGFTANYIRSTKIKSNKKLNSRPKEIIENSRLLSGEPNTLSEQNGDMKHCKHITGLKTNESVGNRRTKLNNKLNMSFLSQSSGTSRYLTRSKASMGDILPLESPIQPMRTRKVSDRNLDSDVVDLRRKSHKLNKQIRSLDNIDVNDGLRSDSQRRVSLRSRVKIDNKVLDKIGYTQFSDSDDDRSKTKKYVY